MAKIQLTVEELLQLIKGNMNVPELKNKLAEALLDVWQRDETRKLIEEKGEELAIKKMERVIESAFKEETTGWGYNKTTKLVGWAIPIIREELAKANLSTILNAIMPELEKTVSELVQKEFGTIVMNMVKSQSNNN